MGSVQGKFLLFHIESDRFVDFHFAVFHISDGSVLFHGGERIEMRFQTVLLQFPADDRVVVPVDESVFRRLVLRDAEFGVYVFLHTVIVSVQMVGSDIHQYGDIGTELIHIIQLEGAELDNIIIVLFHCHLQGEAVADVSGQSHVQSRTLENVVNERSSGSLTVRTCNTNHFSVCITSGKFYLGDDRDTFLFQFQNQRRVIRDTGAFYHLIGIEYQLFGMLSFLPSNVIPVQQFLVFVFNGGHIGYERIETLNFGEYGSSRAAFACS